MFVFTVQSLGVVVGGGGWGKLYFLGGKQCVKSIDFKGYFFLPFFFLTRGFLLEV